MPSSGDRKKLENILNCRPWSQTICGSVSRLATILRANPYGANEHSATGWIQFLVKTCSVSFIAIALLGFADCPATGVSRPATLTDYVAEADTAYRHLPASLSAYNSAVRGICDAMQAGNPQAVAAGLH